MYTIHICFYRAWVARINVRPYSNSFTSELETKHAKNSKLQRAINEMQFCKQQMENGIQKESNAKKTRAKRNRNASPTETDKYNPAKKAKTKPRM